MNSKLDGQSVLTFIDDGVAAEKPLLKERILIGRAEGCDLCFPFHQEVSRLHASLSATEQGWVVEDVTSRAGTFVNGERVLEPHLLRDNDVLKIGTLKLTYREKKHSGETVDITAGMAAEMQRMQEEMTSAPASQESTKPVSIEDTIPIKTIPTPGEETAELFLNYYEMIGVENFEPDIARIHDVAKARLQDLQKNPQSSSADEPAFSFDEVSKAMFCLTDAKSKMEYDQRLAEDLGLDVNVVNNRVVPARRAGGMEEVAIVGVALIVLVVAGWFGVPWILRTISSFFDQIQQSTGMP